MGYFTALPVVLAIVLLLWWRWYIRRQRFELGELLAWREAVGLTQEQAAEMISRYLHKRGKKGIDPKTYSRWERGETQPHPMTYLMIKQLFDASAVNKIAPQARRDDLDILDAFAGKRTPSSPPRMVIMTMDAAEAFYKDELEELAKRGSHRKRHRARKKRHSK